MISFRNLIPPPIFCIALALGAAPHYFETPLTIEASQLETSELQQTNLGETLSEELRPFGVTLENLDIETIEHRPLFSPSRRQFQTQTAPPPTDEPDVIPTTPVQEALGKQNLPPQVSFIGFVATEGNMQGLFRVFPEQEDVWLQEGDELSGWNLIQVTQTAATFQKAASEHVVEINQ